MCIVKLRSVTSDDQGNLYAISNDDELFYYRDEARNGSAHWAFDGVGQKIGNGWGDIHRVFSGGDGILYAITWDGHLLFFRDEARDGSERWAFGGTGQDLGRAKTPDGADAGWLSFWTVFSGGDGIIYAITFDGDLLYFKDVARDGRNVWAAGGAGQRIGTGWGDFLQVFPGGDGVIYAVLARGAILYYRDEARDGTSRWAFDGVGQEIGQGWGGFWTMFPGGDGIVYALTPTGTMFYYRDESRDGRFGWSFEGRWPDHRARLEHRSARGLLLAALGLSGRDNRLSIAAPAGCQVDYLRLNSQPDDALGSAVGPPTNVPPIEQITDPNWPSNGCGWSTTFTLAVPPDWASDLYSARCTDSAGTEFHIVFVVKPVAERRGDLLVVASTNTWNAYNMWGGYSKYGPATPMSSPFCDPTLRRRPWTTATSITSPEPTCGSYTGCRSRDTAPTSSPTRTCTFRLRRPAQLRGPRTAHAPGVLDARDARSA